MVAGGAVLHELLHFFFSGNNAARHTKSLRGVKGRSALNSILSLLYWQWVSWLLSLIRDRFHFTWAQKNMIHFIHMKPYASRRSKFHNNFCHTLSVCMENGIIWWKGAQFVALLDGHGTVVVVVVVINVLDSPWSTAWNFALREWIEQNHSRFITMHCMLLNFFAVHVLPRMTNCWAAAKRTGSDHSHYSATITKVKKQ